MLRKPSYNTNGTIGSGCIGCPLYGDGLGWVPDKVNEESEVVIIGQNPGKDEEAGRVWNGESYEACDPQPFTGKTGYELGRLLPVSGLQRKDISVGNALRCRLNHTDTLPPLRSKVIREAISQCTRVHLKLPPKTRILVAQGEYALFALTGEGLEEGRKLGDWRGYLLPYGQHPPRNIYCGGSGPSVFSTYHIAYTFRDPVAKRVTLMDMAKLGQILSGTWPVVLPLINLGPPQTWPAISAFDTEFNPKDGHLICYSLYDGHILRVSEQRDYGIVVNRPVIIMHNAIADMPYLPFSYDYEDTMHAHGVLWPDLLHNLDFLGSLYAPINRWKHLVKTNFHVYSAADAFATWHLWERLKGSLYASPSDLQTYERQKKLIPIIARSEKHGVATDQTKVDAHYRRYEAKRLDLYYKAQAIAGWPINVRSNPQTARQLYEVERQR